MVTTAVCRYHSNSSNKNNSSNNVKYGSVTVVDNGPSVTLSNSKISFIIDK